MADQENPPSVEEIALTIDVARRTIRKIWELVGDATYHDDDGYAVVEVDELRKSIDKKFPGWRK